MRPELLVCLHEAFHALLSRQPAMTPFHGVMCTDPLDIPHQLARIIVSHGDELSVHDGLRETALHEHVPDIMHIQEG